VVYAVLQKKNGRKHGRRKLEAGGIIFFLTASDLSCLHT